VPKVDSDTWRVWQPPPGFATEFASWPEPGPGDAPEEVRVWCKAFIPQDATSEVIDGHNVMPIELPGGLPVPGYRGQCAVSDGRSWTDAPFDGERPADARFAARLAVRLGHGGGVWTAAKCGFSRNLCCARGSCQGVPFGNITCGPRHCPDDRMQVRRLRCWTEAGVRRHGWTAEGEDCTGAHDVLAAKAYFYGRGGDPCIAPLGKPAPPATWDIGALIFPTKRRVWLTGFVDDAPATECYAQTKDSGVWAQPVPLVQLPPKGRSLMLNLIGFSDRPVNPHNRTVTLHKFYIQV